MKRDVFFRGTRMVHRYGLDSEPEYFDPQFPKKPWKNSKPLTAHDQGEYSGECRDAIRKPNGISAKRGGSAPEEHFTFMGVFGRRKR